VRAREGPNSRKNRVPAPRFKFKDGKKINPAVAQAQAEKGGAV